jgi:hypothetical protein
MTPADLNAMDLKTYHLLPSDDERARFLRHVKRVNTKPSKYETRAPSLFISWGRIVLPGDAQSSPTSEENPENPLCPSAAQK